MRDYFISGLHTSASYIDLAAWLQITAGIKKGEDMSKMSKSCIVTFLICIFLGFSVHPCNPAEQDNATAEFPPELPSWELKKHDPSLFVSPETVLYALKQKQDMVLVDVRDARDFESFRIPGSINIPLFALRTKTFLKHKQLVLINEGFNYGPLERECRNLKDTGFNRVRILKGGLRYWNQKGLPVEGDVFSLKNLKEVSPREFFSERNYGNVAVVDVSETMGPEARQLMPRAKSLPYPGQAKKFVGELKKMLYRHEGDPLMSVLIYNRNGTYPERMVSLIRKAGIKSVFYLRGGLEGYGRFLKQQALIRQTKNSKKIVKRCVTCR
ncbi:MAG: rhodanese-like domain-containing protein [Deltaproteobacteria bacterium]|nr:rhodanese-like domain-containing protein [Deltaproteobacteria bacterium]